MITASGVWRRAWRLAVVSGFIFLAACATPQNPDAQVAAWLQANPAPAPAPRRVLIVEVASADTLVGRGMAHAALQSGVRSKALVSIVSVLESPSPAVLLVTGRDEGMTAATLEVALKAVTGKAGAGHRVVLLGVTSVPPAVAKAAQSAQVSVEAGTPPTR